LQRSAAPARPRGWWNEYVALFLTVWMVGTVVWALGHAGWDPLLRRLPLVAVPAVALGYGFTKLWRVPVAALHALALLGGALACWLVTITAPGVASGSPRHRTVLVWHRGVAWVRAASSVTFVSATSNCSGCELWPGVLSAVIWSWRCHDSDDHAGLSGTTF